MADKYDKLKLENQLCFPLYAASREIIRKYKPVLDEIDLTYTQYIVMMVLWNMDDLGVGEMKVKDLIRKDQGAQAIDIDGAGLGDFKKIANKYGVDFAIVKALSLIHQSIPCSSKQGTQMLLMLW